MVNFTDGLKSGKIGEDIFKTDFLEFLDIKYQDVTGCQKFQVIDTDFLTKIRTYEIKTNYRDDKRLIIEEYTNINETFGPISLGWFHKSTADLFCFVSKASRTIVLVPNNEKFRQHYKQICQSYELKRNKVSFNNGNRWQSAFRIIPFEAIQGYFSVYKKIA